MCFFVKKKSIKNLLNWTRYIINKKTKFQEINAMANLKDFYFPTHKNIEDQKIRKIILY